MSQESSSTPEATRNKTPPKDSKCRSVFLFPYLVAGIFFYLVMWQVDNSAIDSSSYSHTQTTVIKMEGTTTNSTDPMTIVALTPLDNYQAHLSPTDLSLWKSYANNNITDTCPSLATTFHGTPLWLAAMPLGGGADLVRRLLRSGTNAAAGHLGTGRKCQKLVVVCHTPHPLAQLPSAPVASRTNQLQAGFLLLLRNPLDVLRDEYYQTVVMSSSKIGGKHATKKKSTLTTITTLSQEQLSTLLMEWSQWRDAHFATHLQDWKRWLLEWTTVTPTTGEYSHRQFLMVYEELRNSVSGGPQLLQDVLHDLETTTGVTVTNQTECVWYHGVHDDLRERRVAVPELGFTKTQRVAMVQVLHEMEHEILAEDVELQSVLHRYANEIGKDIPGSNVVTTKDDGDDDDDEKQTKTDPTRSYADLQCTPLPSPPPYLGRPLWLASYPGSGSDILPHLLAATTGHVGGIIYHGSHCRKQSRICQTHWPTYRRDYDKSIPEQWTTRFSARFLLLARHPQDAIPQVFLHEYTSQHETFSIHAWEEWRNANFQVQLAQWKQLFVSWLLETPQSTHFTKSMLLLYEDLVDYDQGPPTLSRRLQEIEVQTQTDVVKNKDDQDCLWYRALESHHEGAGRNGTLDDATIVRTTSIPTKLLSLTAQQQTEMLEMLEDLGKRLSNDEEVTNMVRRYSLELRANME